MKFDFLQTTFFNRELKRLAKKQRSIKNDIIALKTKIENNEPIVFDDLGGGLKKVRLKITSKGNGKSGGARIITQDIIIDISNTTIILVAIWDKSEIENIDTEVLRKIVSEFTALQ